MGRSVRSIRRTANKEVGHVMRPCAPPSNQSPSLFPFSRISRMNTGHDFLAKPDSGPASIAHTDLGREPRWSGSAPMRGGGGATRRRQSDPDSWRAFFRAEQAGHPGGGDVHPGVAAQGRGQHADFGVQLPIQLSVAPGSCGSYRGRCCGGSCRPSNSIFPLQTHPASNSARS
jgi:hypothetical protein